MGTLDENGLSRHERSETRTAGRRLSVKSSANEGLRL